MRVRGGAERRALASEHIRKTEFPEDDRGAFKQRGPCSVAYAYATTAREENFMASTFDSR